MTSSPSSLSSSSTSPSFARARAASRRKCARFTATDAPRPLSFNALHRPARRPSISSESGLGDGALGEEPVVPLRGGLAICVVFICQGQCHYTQNEFLTYPHCFRFADQDGCDSHRARCETLEE
ncbi:hypothetical protein K474DRAFT_397242 [Panus rudis PR-1116 ss-1]|nr:hypothetical protein K474DRAFT_397242 [Panus rudis PR-1116 ss-1]